MGATVLLNQQIENIDPLNESTSKPGAQQLGLVMSLTMRL
jgi:hypothetical protein